MNLENIPLQSPQNSARPLFQQQLSTKQINKIQLHDEEVANSIVVHSQSKIYSSGNFKNLQDSRDHEQKMQQFNSQTTFSQISPRKPQFSKQNKTILGDQDDEEKKTSVYQSNMSNSHYRSMNDKRGKKSGFKNYPAGIMNSRKDTFIQQDVSQNNLDAMSSSINQVFQNISPDMDKSGNPISKTQSTMLTNININNTQYIKVIKDKNGFKFKIIRPSQVKKIGVNFINKLIKRTNYKPASNLRDIYIDKIQDLVFSSVENGYKSFNSKNLQYIKKKNNIIVRKIKEYFHKLMTIIPIMNPLSNFIVWFQIFYCAFMSIAIFMMPIEMISRERFINNIWWYGPYLFCAFILLIVKIIINFHVSYDKGGNFIEDRKLVGKKYLKGNFIFDLISCIPFILDLTGISDKNTTLLKKPHGFILIQFWSYFVLLQKIREYYITNRAKYYTLQLIYLFLQTITLGHFLGYMYWALAVNEYKFNIHDTSWMIFYDLEDTTWYNKYTHSLYFAVTTMTTVGYGDFVPLTTAEKYFVVVTQIVSNSFFAYLLNFIGEIILEKSREKVVYKKQLTLLNKYLKKKNIEQDLQFQVRNYFAYQLKNQKELSYEEELQVFDSLSKDLKKRVTLDANLQLVKKLKFMNQFSKQTQEKLALVIQEIPYQENEIIYQEGEVDEDPCLYFIDSGEVQLYIESYKGEIEYTNFSLLKKGQYFGESSFVLNQARLISAKAIQMTRVFKLTRDTFLTIIKDDQHDLEIFSQIQYELLHGIQNKHFACKICGENNHYNYVCPFTHLVIDKTKLILTYNQSTPHQNREPNPRNKLHKFNTLTNLKIVKECFDKFVKELFDDIQKIFGISSLGEDYIEFTTSQMDNNYSESNSFSSGSSSESVNFLQNSQVFNPEQQDLNEIEQQIYNQRIQQELEVIPEDYRQSQNDLNNQSSLKQYSNQNTLTNINNSEKSPITAKLRKRNKSKVNGFKPNRQFEFYGQVNPVIQSTSNDPFISASIHQNDNLNSEKTNNNSQDQNYAKNFLNRLGDKKKTQMLSKNFNTKLVAHNNVDSPLLNEKQNKQPFSQYKNINPQILQIPNNHFDMAGSQISVNSKDHSRPLSPHTHKHKNSKKQSLRNQQQQQFFNHQFYPNQIPFNQMQYPPQSPMQFSNQQSKFYKQYHQKNGRRPSIYNQNAQFQKLSLQQMQQFQLQQQQQQYQQQFNSPLLSNPYMQQQSMYYNSQFNPQNSFQNHGMDHYGMEYGQQSQFKKGKGLLDYSSMNQNSLMNRLNSKSLIKTSKIGNLTPVITKQQLKFQALENQQHQHSLMEQEKSQNSLFQVVHKEQILTPQQGFDSQQGVLKDQDNVYSQQENIYQTQQKTIENVTILEKPTNFKYFYPEFNLNIEKMMEDYKLYKDREFPNYFGIYSYFNRFQLGDRKILKPKQSVKKSSFQVGDFNNFKGGKSKNFISSKVQNYLSELKKSKTPTLQLSKKL